MEKIYSKTWLDYYTYFGKAIEETSEYYVDPLKAITGSWIYWCKNDLPKIIEDQCREKGVKPLKLDVYAEIKDWMFGLVKYPKIRVIFLHTSKSIILILILLVGLGIIIYLILHEAKEVIHHPITTVLAIGLFTIGITKIISRGEK